MVLREQAYIHDRAELCRSLNIPPKYSATIKEMLMKICILEPGKGWRLKLDTDNDFISKRELFINVPNCVKVSCRGATTRTFLAGFEDKVIAYIYFFFTILELIVTFLLSNQKKFP